ncbi:unnamed protein product [Oppiella nova]|uniref:Aspartate aminotransferase, mitochondrial n=1 Tax=Oppiella nova TaxID=334625 RepID=A0A7R9M356_9ACAR|nr:unnamed protein product [Oppiella nova]CAG2169775.1 unnamed protein product [Oppiella nova]
MIDIMKRRNLFAFLDCAYQGFASGSVEEDSRVVKLFAERMNQVMIALTFAKNMGLYGERIGALSVVCRSAQEADNVLTQLKRIIRPIYSHPPNWGARLVTLLLNDHHLKTEWFNDVKNMQMRISDMRSQLVRELNRLSNGKYSWDFILQQKGMYCFTGFTEQQSIQLRQEFAVYIATDGRINIAAINDQNIKQIANAIHSVKTNY